MTAISLEEYETPRLPTGVTGLDQIMGGGLPAGRSALIAGTAGSGKTVVALEYVIGGVRDYDEPGVIVSFEENPENLARHARSFGWDIDALVRASKVATVDATPEPDDLEPGARTVDLSSLLARVEAAVESVGANGLCSMASARCSPITPIQTRSAVSYAGYSPGSGPWP